MITGLSRLNASTSRAPAAEVDGALELVDHALDDVVLDRHAVGRDVVAADAVVVARRDRVDRQAEAARDRVDDGLDREHALRPAIAAERRVRHGVGLARQAAEAEVRQPVAIVGMAQRAREHGRRVVGDVAAVGRQREIEREDAPVVVEADVVADQERMALAGRAHVVVARQPQLHRPPRLPGQHRGDAGDDGRLALLAAEGAAHAPHLDGHGVERQAEQMRDAVLHLGRMLGGAEPRTSSPSSPGVASAIWPSR